LRLRCLVVKGDVDLDLDTDLARRDWTEARFVADSLEEAGWANRARGELAVVSFLQGNHEAAALGILAAIQKARQIGDISSVVRYETLVGDGLVQWKQYDKALSYFDSALQIAKSEPDIQYPLLLYSGRIEALIGLGRASEATELLRGALVAAKKTGAIGYQSELHFRYGLLNIRQGLQTEALQELRIATELGDSINSPRLAAQSTFTLAKCLESKGELKEAATAINASVQRSRQAGDRIMLPETLAEAARIQTALGHSSLADRYFDEASEIASGVLGSVANLTGKDEFINSLDRLYLDHFRFHVNKREVEAAFNVAEQVHGRAVADLLRVGLAANKGASAQTTPGEKRIAHLQLALMNSTNRGDRTRLLAALASAEEEAYPSFVDRSASTRRVGDTPIALRSLQQSLSGTDMLLEYYLANPLSYCILVTRSTAHICELPSKDQIERLVDNHLNAIASKRDIRDSGRQLFKTILPIESMTTSNLIIVPDGALHRLPFDTMVDDRGEFLLATHSVSYVPSATVLGLLSKRSVTVSGRPLL
jgi:tetratricopeptide (TPR) repeat protein